MPVYQVPIIGPNGTGAGMITVNANDPGSAIQNASQGGNTPNGQPTCVSGCNPPAGGSGGGGSGTGTGGATGTGAGTGGTGHSTPSSASGGFTDQITSWIQKNPMPAVGIAAIAGILLSRMR